MRCNAERRCLLNQRAHLDLCTLCMCVRPQSPAAGARLGRNTHAHRRIRAPSERTQGRLASAGEGRLRVRGFVFGSGRIHGVQMLAGALFRSLMLRRVRLLEERDTRTHACDSALAYAWYYRKSKAQIGRARVCVSI